MESRMPVCIHSMWIEENCERCERVIESKDSVTEKEEQITKYVDRKAKIIEKLMNRVLRKQSTLASKLEYDDRKADAYATETRAMIVNTRKDIERLSQEIAEVKYMQSSSKIGSLVREAEQTRDRFKQACNEISSYRNSFGNALDSVCQKIAMLEQQINVNPKQTSTKSIILLKE